MWGAASCYRGGSMARARSIESLLEGLRSPSADVKYGCAKSLRLLSEQTPERLYPHFDLFFSLFEGQNTILRWGATRILGNLAAADREDKLEAAFDRFFAPVLGHEMIGAANVIQAASQIALAKPRLADRIAGEILQVEGACYRTPECRNVAIGHAIQAFDRFLPQVTLRGPVMEFVQRQLENPRPATRHKAERFLKRWAAGNHSLLP